MENLRTTICSIRVQEAYDYDNTLFEGCIMDSDERTQKFKDKFLASWGIYEIGTETIAEFKEVITNIFNLKKDYYIELLNWQEKGNVDLEAPTYTDEKDYIDLPNKQTDKEYITNKEKSFGETASEKLDRKLRYLKTIKNIWQDFMEEFREAICFVYQIH